MALTVHRRAMRTFVCIVPVTRRRVITDNGESLQRRERLCPGRSTRLFQCTRAKQAYAEGDLEGVMRDVSNLSACARFALAN